MTDLTVATQGTLFSRGDAISLGGTIALVWRCSGCTITICHQGSWRYRWLEIEFSVRRLVASVRAWWRDRFAD